MTTQIQELNDGRFIGCNVLEVVALPEADSFDMGAAEAVTRTAQVFGQAIFEFHKLGGDGNTVAELLWLTQRAERQTFRSRIRLFLVMRKIGPVQEVLRSELSAMQNNFATLLNARRYETVVVDDDFASLGSLLAAVDSSCVYAVIKTEKCVGNAMSPYPYYYCDVVPQGNDDNFEAIVSALSQYDNCCLSFQLFPTALTAQELYLINEQSAELERLVTGLIAERQIIKDAAAAAPQRVLAYYGEHGRSPLFTYNLLIFGPRTACAGLATRVISLLKAGKNSIINADFGCLDLTQERIDLGKQWSIYPWNVNSRQMYAYRNQQLFQAIPMAKALFRLPYIMTTEEATAFFRLPLHDKNMVALRGNQKVQTLEQFDAAVTDENSLSLGVLRGNAEVSIGCPEKALTKHALVVGMPGSGKTTFSINLLLQLQQRDIPFLAIEPTKTEYRAMIDAIPALQIFTPGNNAVSPFIINPFLPPRDISIEQYIPSLASAFKAAFSMPSPLDILFLRAIRTCYTEHGWKDYSRLGDSDVTIFGLREFIRCFKRIISNSNYSREVKGNIESGGVFRLMNLIEQNGNIYDVIHSVPIEDILSAPTVLELNSIDNAEQKALIMALLLINICIYTKHHHSGNGELKNVILIDEAHVLLSNSPSQRTDGAESSATTIKALQDMIVEIRSFGTGIIIADQSPTKVSREVVANTDIKVAFRLVQSAEKELIADSTNMDADGAQQLGRLHPGEAYVYYSRLETPQLVITEDVRDIKGIRQAVSDAEITARAHYWDNKKQLLRPYAECAFCPDCSSDCDFSLRSQAEYYAARLFEKNAASIKDAATLMRYLLSMNRLLEKVTDSLPVEQKSRLTDCCRLKFLRIMELETSLTLSKKELLTVLLR